MLSISYNELEKLFNLIFKYISHEIGKSELGYKEEEDILLAKDIDYIVKTYAEQAQGGDFIKASHGPKRIAIFLLNAYGEHAVDGAKITIYDDDLQPGKASHDNTYKLVFNSTQSHNELDNSNPTAADRPYDFNTIFLKQITRYPDNTVDTTATAWDSFHKGYQNPFRTFDFKSALWTSNKHSHNVNYILKLLNTGEFKLFLHTYIDGKETYIPKQFKLELPVSANMYIKKYLELLSNLNKLDGLTWEDLLEIKPDNRNNSYNFDEIDDETGEVLNQFYND